MFSAFTGVKDISGIQGDDLLLSVPFVVYIDDTVHHRKHLLSVIDMPLTGFISRVGVDAGFPEYRDR